MKRKRKSKNIKTILITIAVLICGLCLNSIQDTYSINNNIVSSQLKVTFIDVGQADSILIQNESENMLIDAGNNEDGDKLVNYFKNLNITDFKYVVGTHPHEDHIGGLDNIINNFKINYIYMPDVITTTKTFEDVLDTALNKNLTITVPKINDTLNLGSATIKVIYTGNDEEDLNNSSIVLKVTFGNTSFLFMGDATEEVENKILNSDIESTVLKVGHHGSKYSTSDEFLNKVNPQYAVISVGINNSYGHPDNIVINKLNNINASIYRTDELGTIIMTSDGNNIKVENYTTDTNGE